MRYSAMTMLVLVMGVAAGCTISNTASDLRGIKGMDGDKLTHINTRNFAVHLFMTKPMIGDATLNTTVQSFADEAKKHGATKARFVIVGMVEQAGTGAFAAGPMLKRIWDGILGRRHPVIPGARPETQLPKVDPQVKVAGR